MGYLYPAAHLGHVCAQNGLALLCAHYPVAHLYSAGGLGSVCDAALLELFVTALEWSAFVVMLDWASFVRTLDWNTYVSPLNWNSYITPVSWGSYIDNVDWGNWIPSLDWGRFVPAFAAPRPRASACCHRQVLLAWVRCQRKVRKVALPSLSRT